MNRFYKALLLHGLPDEHRDLRARPPAHPAAARHTTSSRSEPALRVLALALGVAFVNNAFIGALNASDRQSSFTWAAGWSLVANLALNLTLIPLFGYQGASWATVATEIVLGIVGWTLTARHVGRVPVVPIELARARSPGSDHGRGHLPAERR